MSKKDDFYDSVIIAIIVSLSVLWLFLYLSSLNASNRYSNGKESDMVMSDGFLKAVVPPVYISPIVYGDIIDKLVACESSGNWDIVILDSNDKYSYSGLQFQMETFRQYCINKYNVAYKDEDIMNKDIQIRCADKMIDDGLIRHWSCSRKI